MARSKAGPAQPRTLKFHNLDTNTCPTTKKKNEPKKLKFHNVFFDKVMETKEVQGTMGKQTSSKGVKRKSTTELIMKEYNPTRKKGEEAAKTRQDKRTSSEEEQISEAVNPLDLRTHTRETAPPGHLGSPPPLEPLPDRVEALTVEEAFARKAEALTIEQEGLTLKPGRPVRLEPRRPFAEALVWHLMSQLRGQGGPVG